MSDQPTGSLPPPSGTKLTWNEVVSAEPKSTTSNDIFGAMPDFPGEIEEPKPRKEDAASPTGEQCPYCPDQGWYVEPNRNTGEPEQVQCEWCNTNPNSVYNQPKPTGEWTADTVRMFGETCLLCLHEPKGETVNEPEPDRIDMMNEAELRSELRAVLKRLPVGSDTPRTNAALQSTKDTTAVYVLADFARKLERELNQSETRYREMRGALLLVAECNYDDERKIKDVPVIRKLIAENYSGEAQTDKTSLRRKGHEGIAKISDL